MQTSIGLLVICGAIKAYLSMKMHLREDFVMISSQQQEEPVTCVMARDVMVVLILEWFNNRHTPANFTVC